MCCWSNVVTIKRKKEQLPPITVSLSLPDHDDKVSDDGYHGDGDDGDGDDGDLDDNSPKSRHGVVFSYPHEEAIFLV